MLRKLGFLMSALLLIALVLPVAAQDEEPFALTIMHTNDVHAEHEAVFDGGGGAARQATVVQQIRDEGGNSVLLDGGDRFTGTLFHIQWQGQDSAQIMNAIGYDAMTLGNHEFDNGDEVLAAFIDALEFPVVTANVDFSESPVLADKVSPYVVLEVGGEQVGVIGLVTPESEILSSPGPELVFNNDLVGVTQSMVDELTEQGVNKIILLTHIGYEADNMVAQNVSGVDVVVGGHTNTFLSNTYAGAVGEYPTVLESASGEPVLVVQASTRTQYLGRLDVEFDAAGLLTSWEGDAILLSRYITPDPDVSDIVAGLAEPIAELQALPVGEAGAFLQGDRGVCRVEECNLGNLIADAMRADTGAQIAFMNGGGIRASIDEGEITLGEVLTVQPFQNLLSTFELSGADVIAALENGVSQIQLNDQGQVSRDGAAGRFLQVSGIRYTIDPTLEPGSRIVSAEVLNDAGEYEPIDPEATYSVATLNFIRTGGDGFSILNDNAINPYDFGDLDFEVTLDYVEANSPVAPETEGRITYVNAEVAPMP
ncbi:MAG: multifunctional 2',3'-cyclic-nucleotide 2'-phosphodiesterase/5'-nucleotidase/3'-nucleotidase [Anaerolineaceae bacterium]|nr:multifunctional 2',3'-cyclic-nucleotide 2'-phosphodiesterase/5'-nucleotidase/3'-nucleotidase [Anaerolineaceae bacterium]